MVSFGSSILPISICGTLPGEQSLLEHAAVKNIIIYISGRSSNSLILIMPSDITFKNSKYSSWVIEPFAELSSNKVKHFKNAAAAFSICRSTTGGVTGDCNGTATGATTGGCNGSATGDGMGDATGGCNGIATGDVGGGCKGATTGGDTGGRNGATTGVGMGGVLGDIGTLKSPPPPPPLRKNRSQNTLSSGVEKATSSTVSATTTEQSNATTAAKNFMLERGISLHL